MKLIDHAETVIVVTADNLEPGHPDLESAARLTAEISTRGAGFPYRRAVVVSDVDWFETDLLDGAPTIGIGGPGANAVTGRLAGNLPSVWTDGDRVIIQARLDARPPQVLLWGMDRFATTEAVDAFLARGWLDEFLERCWRFPTGTVA
ncbi:MAG TPA: hypothetical protein VFN22_03650 [Gemmatimonadales bacterium]|nr:hypothetical protein [Gemmatimonadales bacterium]